MSRQLSPKQVARRAERAAKDAANRRKEMRQSFTFLVGVAVVTVGLMVVGYFFLRHAAKQKHDRHHHHGRSNVASEPSAKSPKVGDDEEPKHE